ncbi:unnamed protein product [Protopolystoma xenopodis]|uniref:Uncharacterized protein n=1 Tax=Protopolystoma xenopodis TaxID=117903 RepID=A0A3S5CER8_9PLAT|nr:unnamed protein product [Protopolystoma xenopodis]
MERLGINGSKLSTGLQSTLHLQLWRALLISEPSAGCKLLASWPLESIKMAYCVATANDASAFVARTPVTSGRVCSSVSGAIASLSSGAGRPSSRRHHTSSTSSTASIIQIPGVSATASPTASNDVTGPLGSSANSGATASRPIANCVSDQYTQKHQHTLYSQPGSLSSAGRPTLLEADPLKQLPQPNSLAFDTAYNLPGLEGTFLAGEQDEFDLDEEDAGQVKKSVGASKTTGEVLFVLAANKHAGKGNALLFRSLFYRTFYPSMSTYVLQSHCLYLNFHSFNHLHIFLPMYRYLSNVLFTNPAIYISLIRSFASHLFFYIFSLSKFSFLLSKL